MIDLVLAAFAVCATGPNSNAALDRWEDLGVPIVRQCDRDSLYITDGKPPLDWDIDPSWLGVTWGKEAYCWAEGWIAVSSCAHEIGHLFGLNHPYENHWTCQGGYWQDPYAGPNWAYNPYDGNGHLPVVNATVMDNGGCPGQPEGPYPADAEAVIKNLTRA